MNEVTNEYNPQFLRKEIPEKAKSETIPGLCRRTYN